MEGDKRKFLPIQVTELGVEKGKQRFPQREDKEPPKIARWRNNLTGLSQRYNLYFAAYTEKIHVYKPQFPTQALRDTPVLILTPPLAVPGALGAIAFDSPHAIDNILIGDLGDEEVLLCACDSGNVAGYRTRDVWNAIERQQSARPEDRVEDGAVQGFFSEWVKMSAWGLAIHKTARLIAVSANSHEITVFSFGLAEPGSESGSGEEEIEIDEDGMSLQSGEWEDYDPKTSYDVTQLRARNFRIVLRGHNANIPSISFYDADQDPEGCWLVSTDIHATMRVWNIWAHNPLVKTHDFSGPLVHHGKWQITSAYPHMGWNVLALDPCAFRTMTTIEETCGTDPESHYLVGDKSKKKIIYDITQAGGSIPNSSAFHPSFANEDNENDSDSAESVISWGEDYALAAIEIQDDVHDEAMEGDIDNEEEDENSSEEFWDAMDQANAAITSHGLAGPNTFQTVAALGNIETNDNPILATEVASQPDDDHDLPVLEPITGYFQESALRAHFSPPPRKIRSSKSYVSPQFFPIFHATETDIRLLGNPVSPDNQIVCHRPLVQHLPPSLQYLNHVDRLNMVHQIPELGIIVLATQTGRVALAALTKMGSRRERGQMDGDLVSMRIDWILPFKSQESRGERPWSSPLLGIAVGPIQGMEVGDSTENEDWHGVEYSRRYRLMLTYYDHSVLSYELNWSGQGRKGEEVSVL